METGIFSLGFRNTLNSFQNFVLRFQYRLRTSSGIFSTIDIRKGAFSQIWKLEKSRTVQNVNAQKFRLSGEAFCGLPIHGG
jgi:hypothetical protein